MKRSACRLGKCFKPFVLNTRQCSYRRIDRAQLFALCCHIYVALQWLMASLLLLYRPGIALWCSRAWVRPVEVHHHSVAVVVDLRIIENNSYRTTKVTPVRQLQ